MPCTKKSVPTVVIREGTRKRTVMTPLTTPTSTQSAVPTSAPIGKGTPQVTERRPMV